MSKTPTQQQFESGDLPEYIVRKFFKHGVKHLRGDIYNPKDGTYQDLIIYLQRGWIEPQT